MEKDQRDIERLFSAPARLRIMATLIAEEKMDFTVLQKQLNLSRGNLSSHGKQLLKSGCLEIQKDFKNNKPRTSYKITQTGYDDFKKYITILESIIQKSRLKE
ncbi:MAG: transcriptional regulator [Fibrobacterota bacterium]